VCTLANNHVLKFGYAGLLETLDTQARAGLKTAGVGRNLAEAREPAVVDLAEKGRLVVFGFGDETSGVPPSWAATDERPGIDFLSDHLSEATARGVVERVRLAKRPGDVVVASIHRGSNWGYHVPPEQQRFARRLIEGGVDIVHGHSSHHARPIEVYRDRRILYGYGDFLDDYEGIGGYKEFGHDLTLMYFPTVETPTGRLERLRLTPMQVQNLRVNRAAPANARWLRDTFRRVSQPFGSEVELDGDGALIVRARSDR
jgi:poly-gamma-glutamate capsule biosynthesis protein CapA/YwtB (metallophosphatase superfamily)